MIPKTVFLIRRGEQSYPDCRAERWSGEGGGEELRLQSREGQDSNAVADEDQLILKMSSEDQTVDHRNKLMGNDQDTIFV